MTRPDLLRRADILSRFGRTKEAIADLEANLAGDPTRHDVALRLKELRQEVDLTKRAKLAGPLHAAVAWCLFIASLLLTTFLPIWGIAQLLPSTFAKDVSDAAFAAVAVGFLAYVVLAAYLAVGIFFRLLFAYLNGLPHDTRATAEASIKSSMADHIFDDRYHLLRMRRLRE